MAYSYARTFLALASLLFVVACDGCDDTNPPDDAGTDAGSDATADVSDDDAGPDAVSDAGPPPPPPPEIFTDVDLDGQFRIPELTAPAHVVRTEEFVPHVYAENDLDARRVLGFVIARDRYFQLDVVARLSQGLITELLGDVGLESDIQSRMTGSDVLTQLYLDALTDEEGAQVDAFVDGINAYATAARAGDLPAPSEYSLVFGLIGAPSAQSLIRDWTRRDVMALVATMAFQTGFETKGPGRAAALARIDEHFPTAPERDLRMAGLMDIVDRWAPPRPTASSAGFGIEGTAVARRPITALGPSGTQAIAPLKVEPQALDRLLTRLQQYRERLHPQDLEGWGSNVWAVMGSATPDGRALLAGDGHLQLSIPSLMWEYGMDTELMGDEDPITVAGVTLIGTPGIATGTNGRVAWGGTNFVTDVTDWYSEELKLDDDGMPVSSVFQGADRPLSRVDEVYEVRGVPILESVERTLTLSRWSTFDGRMITAIEGRPATEGEAVGNGEVLVNVMGDWIVPGDEDGDGKVTAMSFYYAPFAGGSLLRAVMGFERADTVEDFRQAMRHVIGFGLNFAAADGEGNVLYTGYHAMPCRSYLPRDPGTGRFEADADPSLLIDGTQYPAWDIPLDAEGRVDEVAAAAGGPTACAVPFDEWPQAVNPDRQYVLNANNDPGSISLDNNPWNDPYYLGGPWDPGYRASRIEQRIERAIDTSSATLAEMQNIQGDHHSNLGEDFAPLLLEVIRAAREASEGSPTAGTPEARMATLYAANSAMFDEVETRMMAWSDDDYPTPSGVDSFYNTSDDDSQRQSVATMIFAAWFPRVLQGVWNDEGINGSVNPGGSWQLRSLARLLAGRGDGNPLSLPSHNLATSESVFFDDIRTADVESSQEIGVIALVGTLEFLAGAPNDDGVSGGFGTEDMSQWRWGLRHQVRFESLLADFIDDPDLASFFSDFNVTTERMPLAPDLSEDDPRAALVWFPRPGDQYDIDAANPGFSGTRFTHRNGPVMRTVVALSPGHVEGHTTLPGGQSGHPASEHFSDRARSWLANETVPLRFDPDQVSDGAVSREVFTP